MYQELASKRDQFRQNIRRVRNEDIFVVKRTASKKMTDSESIQLPQFQSTQDLHVFLVKDEQNLLARIRAVLKDEMLLTEVKSKAKVNDYFALLVLCNLCYVESVAQADIIFFEQLGRGMEIYDNNLMNTCLSGIENFLSRELNFDQLNEFSKHNLYAKMKDVIARIIDQEKQLLAIVINILFNYTLQFRHANLLSKQIISLQADRNVISIFNQLQQFLNSNFEYSRKIIQLMLEFIRSDELLLQHIQNDTIEKIISHLHYNDDIYVLVALRFFIQITSLENEVYSQRALNFQHQDLLQDLMRLVHSPNPKIRQYAYNILSNLANCDLTSIRQKMVQLIDSMYHEVINTLKNTDDGCEDIIYLLYGWLVNCYDHFQDEEIYEGQLLSILSRKLDDYQNQSVTTLIAIVKLLAGILAKYNVEKLPCIKMLKENFQKMCYYPNKEVSVVCTSLLNYIQEK